MQEEQEKKAEINGMSYLLDNSGIIMIKIFENYYYNLDKIKNNLISSDITLYAHKDRVGFFVVGKKGGNYILKIYGKIPENTLLVLTNLFSLKKGIINIKIIEKYSGFIFVKTNKTLDNSDFLMFVPDYKIEGDYLIGPYLDNVVGNITADKFKHCCDIYHSIDEETKLIYSTFNSDGIAIVLDTIWQDYIKDKIKLNKIYNIVGTKFTKGEMLNFSEILNINLELSFKTEFDFLLNKEKYFLLCPIENGHSPNSRIKLSTFDKYLKVLGKLINKINEKYSYSRC